MAKPKEGKVISGIGEFCCASSFIQFQVCKLGQHVEKVIEKLGSIDEENQGIYEISKYLAQVERTLSSVEQEIIEKRKRHQKSNAKVRSRYLTERLKV